MVMLQRWLVSWRENGHVTEVVSLMERMVVTNETCLMEGEWSCYGGGQFKGVRMVMLRRLSLQWRGKGHQRW